VAESGDPTTAREERLSELSRNPHPSAHRAALAVRHPSWGIATVLLLVVGIVVGYLSLHAAAATCQRAGGASGCVPGGHPLIVVLPVGGLVVGLVLSLIGGRLLTRLHRSPLPAAVLGWVVFVVATVVGLTMVAGH
jgi:hypothetical protein